MNPVQTTAWKIDAPTLKAEFDNSLGFWGAVDTQ